MMFPLYGPPIVLRLVLIHSHEMIKFTPIYTLDWQRRRAGEGGSSTNADGLEDISNSIISIMEYI